MFQIQVMGAGGFKHAGQKPAFSQGRQHNVFVSVEMRFSQLLLLIK